MPAAAAAATDAIAVAPLEGHSGQWRNTQHEFSHQRCSPTKTDNISNNNIWPGPIYIQLHAYTYIYTYLHTYTYTCITYGT